MINNRYNIKEQLGQGGSGTVYLAEDTLQENHTVAFKVLHPQPDGTEDSGLKEVSLLMNLSHPGLVRIFDTGVVLSTDSEGLLGRSFFTMEYIEGGDAMMYSRNINAEEKRTASIESMLFQCLGVLHYIHREGIIHHDIKPQNVMVSGREGGTPRIKLTDFGFGTRGNVDAASQPRGTIEYIAPEVLQGGTPSRSVDLYSLGATFFHLLEGSPPFEDTDPVSLIKSILTQEPVFRKYTDSAGQSLRQTILQLLAREPGGRFPSALNAATHLAGPRKDLLGEYFGFAYKPPFVGRRKELDLLSRSIDALGTRSTDATPRWIGVHGPQGIGKTSLLDQSVYHARMKNLHTFLLRVKTREFPFDAILPVIHLIMAHVKSFSEEHSAIVTRYAEVARAAASGSSNPLWTEEQTSELLASCLVECSEVFPFLLVADDAELIDTQSWKVLETVVNRALPGRVLLLMATGGKQEGVLPAGKGSPLQLGDLEPEVVEEMVRSATDSQGYAGELAGHMYRLYGGNPGLITEILHVLQPALFDLIQTSERSDQQIIEGLLSLIPADVNEALLGRYRGLGSEARIVLDYLSCCQGPIPAGILTAILPFHSERAHRYLRFLELDGFVETSDSGRRYSLRMASLKQSIAESLGEIRTHIHTIIADALEQLPPVQSVADLQELAVQMGLSGRFAKASSYAEKAAESASEAAAYPVSIRLYRQAVEYASGTGDAQRVVALKILLVSTCGRGGDFQAVLELVQELLQIQSLSREQATIVRKWGGVAYSRIGEYEPANAYILQALEGTVGEAERFELNQERIGIELARGNFEDAERMCLDQLAISRKLNDGRLTAAVNTDLGIATFYLDRFDDAIRFFNEALQLYEKAGSKNKLADAMLNVGNAMSAKGDFAGAITMWSRALEVCRLHGTANQEGHLRNSLGIAYFNLKQLDEALKCYENARDIFKRIESKSGLANAVTNMGEAFLADGKYEHALLHLLDARGMYEEMDDVQGIAETSLQIAQTQLLVGDDQAAAAALAVSTRRVEEKHLEPLRAQLSFLSGLSARQRIDLNSALEYFARARAEYGNSRNGPLAGIRSAECLLDLGKPGEAFTTLQPVLHHPETPNNPALHAEALYMAGRIAGASPSATPERPLVYLKAAFESLKKEPVSELTWKVSYALAHAYLERGQKDRAREFFLRTRMVIQYFLGQFISEERKHAYIALDDKANILTQIDHILNSQGEQ